MWLELDAVVYSFSHRIETGLKKKERERMGALRLKILRKKMRQRLFDDLWGISNQGGIAISGRDKKFAWLKTAEHIRRAVNAYTRDALHGETFTLVSQNGHPYRRSGRTHVHLDPVRDGEVAWLCADLDGRTISARYMGPLIAFFGAKPMAFCSRGGKGLHLFWKMKRPMPVDRFLRWAKSWRFNTEGRPELFPRGTQATVIALPSKPIGDGDRHISGGKIGVVDELPPELPSGLEPETVDFLLGVVRRGHRNVAVHNATFDLAKAGMDRDKADPLLHAGAHRCGLLADERPKTEATIKRAWEKGIARSAPKTAQDLAARFATTAEGANFLWAADRRCWLHWDGRCWRPTVEECVRASLQTYIETLAKNARWKNAGMLRSVVFELESIALVREDELDQDIGILNCESGTIDLKTGELRQHNRQDRLTRCAPASYNPKIKPGIWAETLAAVFADDPKKINFLQRFVGYAASGALSEEVMLFAHGSTGSNGKSTLFETIRAALGPYHVGVPAELIFANEGAWDGGASYSMANLARARIALMSEVPRNAGIREENLKNIVDGPGKIRFRQIRCEWQEVDRTASIIAYSNHDVRVESHEGAVWRRLIRLDFTQRFTRASANVELKRTLAESARDEVLAWIVRGSVSWYRSGLKIPAAVEKSTAAWRYGQDTLGAFLAARTEEVDSGESVPVAKIYREFKAFCRVEARRMPFAASDKFSAALGRRGLDIQRKRSEGSRVSHVLGISLR